MKKKILTPVLLITTPLLCESLQAGITKELKSSKNRRPNLAQSILWINSEQALRLQAQKGKVLLGNPVLQRAFLEQFLNPLILKNHIPMLLK